MRLACQPGNRLQRTLVLSSLVTLAFVILVGRAQAVILPAVTIDGPSSEIVGFGGVAMAEDGTGGLVYLKRVGGVTHVFVSRYIGGHWQAPIRVDTEQPYAASWPRIGAADGGELMVVWVTPFATEEEHPVDELLSAGTVIPEPRRNKPHRDAWALWRRRHQYGAQQAHQRWHAYADETPR